MLHNCSLAHERFVLWDYYECCMFLEHASNIPECAQEVTGCPVQPLQEVSSSFQSSCIIYILNSKVKGYNFYRSLPTITVLFMVDILLGMKD